MNKALDKIGTPFTYKIILASIAVLLYLNVLNNGYNLDDNLVTQKHPLTSKGVSAIGKIFTSPYYTNQADITFGYRPIVHLSFAIEHQLFGEKPAVSHLINILLYASCVLLLFKLFSKLDTSENKMVSFIASLLFVVHPVHTEVVASIKNRDELLSFLFILLSAISVFKFVNKNNILQILLASLYFAFAMLSKKSAYPMAVLIPIAAVLLNNLSVKQTLIITTGLAIPAAMVASDFIFIKAILLIAPPLVAVILAIFFIYKNTFVNRLIAFFSPSNKRIIIYFLSNLFLLLSIFTNELLFLIPLISVYVLAPKSSLRQYVIVVMFQLAIVSLYFAIPRLATLCLVFSIGELFGLFIKKEKNYFNIIMALLTCLIYLIIQNEIKLLSLVLSLAVFYFLLNKKTSWALLYILFTIGISGKFYTISYYQFVLLAIALFQLIKTTNQNILWYKYLVIVSALAQAVYLVLLPNSPTQFRKILNNIVTKNTAIENPIVFNNNNQNGNFKEGRGLHYIENTLVAQHTPIQKIATGFTTLSEYLRLMVFPNNLSFYYGYAIITTTSLNQLSVWLSILIHLGLIFLALWQIKKRPLISIGIGWYLLCIVLFSNWIELVAGMVGERLAFSASAGFCLSIAALLVWFKPNFSFTKPKFLELSVFVVLILFGVRTIARNTDWKDPLTLMSNDINHLEESAYAQHTLALNLMYRSTQPGLTQQKAIQMQTDAILHLKKSIAIYPSFFNTNFDLARVYIGQEDYANAKPNLENALKLDSTNLFVLEELAKTCFELKQPLETELYANKYLDKVPMNENVHEILIYSMITNNFHERALIYAERALKYYPQNMVINQMYADAKKQVKTTE